MMLWLFVTPPMVLLVLEAEFCDGTNCLDLHGIWPGLQKGGVLSRVYMEEVLGKKYGTYQYSLLNTNSFQTKIMTILSFCDKNIL